MHITCVTNPTIIQRFIRIQRFTESTRDNESLNIPLNKKRLAHANNNYIIHPSNSEISLRIVANPSLLFDTRAACRGNEARVGYVQRSTYSNEIRAANRERKGGNSVFPKATITYGGITVKCAPLRREKWPLCGCSRLRSSDGFFLALAILLISRVVAASTALHPPSFPLQS